MVKQLALVLSFITAASCASTFPNERLYVADVTNQVCAEYVLKDAENLTFEPSRDTNGKPIEYALLPKSPCDRMAGWSTTGFKHVQNWARDEIKAHR